MFDELFRGTNAIERIAAAEAVLQYLLGQRSRATPHFVLAATHDIELVELLDGFYEPYHFSEQLGPGGLLFDHHLQPGVTTTRNGIALLQLHAAPSGLVARPLARAAALEDRRNVNLAP